MSKNKQKTQSILLHEGKLFLVENSQKGYEEYLLKIFLESEEGQKWIKEHSIDINSKIRSESPDFIFSTKNGDIIGIELTQFILKNVKDKEKTHAENILSLYRIGLKVVEYFKQKKNIPLSLTIEIYDKRKLSPNFKEHLDYLNNPTTPILNINFNKLKDLIIKRIEEVGVTNWEVSKEYIDFDEHTFCITFDKFYEPYTNVHVNSTGLSIQDPFINLQERINQKNDKYKSYLKQCTKCYLLIINEDSSKGNCVDFSEKTFKQKYESKFPAIYLMDFSKFNQTNVKQLQIKT